MRMRVGESPFTPGRGSDNASLVRALPFVIIKKNRRKSGRGEQLAPRMKRAWHRVAGAYAQDLFCAHSCCPNTTHVCIVWFIRIILAPLSKGAAPVSFFLALVFGSHRTGRRLHCYTSFDRYFDSPQLSAAGRGVFRG